MRGHSYPTSFSELRRRDELGADRAPHHCRQQGDCGNHNVPSSMGTPWPSQILDQLKSYPLSLQARHAAAQSMILTLKSRVSSVKSTSPPSPNLPPPPESTAATAFTNTATAPHPNLSRLEGIRRPILPCEKNGTPSGCTLSVREEWEMEMIGRTPCNPSAIHKC